MLLGGLKGQVLPWQTTLRNQRRRLGALKADMFVRSNVTESSLAENMQTAAIHEPGPFPDPAVLCHLLAVTRGFWPFVLFVFSLFSFSFASYAE